MFSIFLHPWFMVAGGALISSPIIIHLINRMRFRRIRWAAMEFLLKAQKRNRRRLIIEQLILLLLRILLVLLAAFLVARFLGWNVFGAVGGQSIVHVLVIDDSLSMNDAFKDEKQGVPTTSFDEARRVIKEIAKKANTVNAPQRIVVFRLSECQPGDDPTASKERTPLFEDRLGDASLKKLGDVLDDKDKTACTLLHVKPIVGFRAARDIIGHATEGKRVIHFISDFRDRDWKGQDSEALYKEIDQLCESGVTVRLIDVAHPYRGDTRQTPLAHDNLGIVDLRPESRVAAQNMPVQFTVSIQNFTNIEKKNVYLTVKADGVERLEASQPIPILKPGMNTHNFQISFNRVGYSVVTAKLPDEETGLQADNLRYALVEVHKKVPVLIIDGSGKESEKSGGDTYYLQSLFVASMTYQIVPGAVKTLEDSRLDQFSSIFLLNVPQLSEKALKNLEDYVDRGGSIAFFLGDKVRNDYYTKLLYKNGDGLFPGPLLDKGQGWRSTSRKDANQPMSDAEKQERLKDGLPKILLRNPEHPMLKEVYESRGFFRIFTIDRYYPVQQTWKPELGKVEVLISLPNLNTLGETSSVDYRRSANELLRRVSQLANDEKYEKYRPGLLEHMDLVRKQLLEKELYLLASALEDLLKEPGDPKNEKQKPNLVKFWDEGDATVQQLRTDIEQFRERILYGDPLVLAKRYGKGRVVAFLTTFGSGGSKDNPPWHDWAGGSRAADTYPVIILEMMKYLGGSGEEISRTVGTPVTLELDGERYERRMTHYFTDDKMLEEGAKKAEGGDRRRPAGTDKMGDVSGPEDPKPLSFTFSQTRKPGVYFFDFTHLGTKQVEDRAYVFNVDTLAEGDLRRAAREDLEKNPPGASAERGKVIVTDALEDHRDITKRQTDASESPWIYLLFLVILVVEQALAVHLSFHLKNAEAAAPVPAAGRAPAAAAA